MKKIHTDEHISLFTPVRKTVFEGVEKKILRRLPVSGELKVGVSDKVSAVDVIGVCKISAGFRVFNVAEILRIPAEKAYASLTKQLGATIYKGEVVAEHKKFFGAVSRQFIAPCDGILDALNQNGQLTIRFLPVRHKLLAGCNGEIQEIIPGEGVFIRSYADIVKGAIGVGFAREGTLKVIAPPSESLSPSALDIDCANQIIVGGALLTKELIQKAITLGVRGIIAGGIHSRDYQSLVGFLNPLEDVGISLLITTGFGRCDIEGPTYTLLQKHQAKHLFLNPHEKEAIIPLPAAIGEQRPEAEQCFRMVKENDTVRILSWPYFGKTGQVKELKEGEIPLESGIISAAAVIELGNKVTVALPIRNLEIVENEHV